MVVLIYIINEQSTSTNCYKNYLLFTILVNNVAAKILVIAREATHYLFLLLKKALKKAFPVTRISTIEFPIKKLIGTCSVKECKHHSKFDLIFMKMICKFRL